VTQTEVVAVNRESIKGVHDPLAEDIGSIKIRAPVRMTAAKPSTMTCGELSVRFPSFINTGLPELFCTNIIRDTV
jgi:hypothetical protein